MTEQMPLFKEGEAHARHTDPGTSKQAAAQVRGQEASHLEQLVLRVIREHPAGLTNHEIVDMAGITWNTATPRVRPLVRKGLVVDSGERRPGPCGKRCIVWRAVALAMLVLVCGCDSSSDRQTLVQRFGTTEVMPIGSSTWIVRDTNGAIWHVSGLGKQAEKLFDAQR